MRIIGGGFSVTSLPQYLHLQGLGRFAPSLLPRSPAVVIFSVPRKGPAQNPPHNLIQPFPVQPQALVDLVHDHAIDLLAPSLAPQNFRDTVRSSNDDAASRAKMFSLTIVPYPPHHLSQSTFSPRRIFQYPTLGPGVRTPRNRHRHEGSIHGQPPDQPRHLHDKLKQIAEEWVFVSVRERGRRTLSAAC